MRNGREDSKEFVVIEEWYCMLMKKMYGQARLQKCWMEVRRYWLRCQARHVLECLAQCRDHSMLDLWGMIPPLPISKGCVYDQ